MHIRVEDNGKGMALRQLNQLNTVLKNPSHSLAMENPSGQIGLRNVASRLHLYFGDKARLQLIPRRPRADRAACIACKSRERGKWNVKALIYVDDEKHVRDAVKMIVEWKRFGFTDIFEAEDGEEAMRMALQERPELIVTDMRMPRADGSKLLEWISHHCPESKVIVVSGHDDFEYVRSTVKYGGIDYILKPIDVDQLNDAVQKAVDSLREEERNRFWEERRNLELNRFRPVYWEKLYSSLLMPEAHTHSTFAELRKEFRLTRTSTAVVSAY